MPLRVVSPQPPTASSESPQKYFKIQVMAWTAFDPKDMKLGEIAARIQLGAGVLTAIEVARVANNVEAIDDAEVRHQFQMLIAVEQLIRNAAALPRSIRDRLVEALANVSREHPAQPPSEPQLGDNTKPIPLP
jgi:hypothetical protein